MLWDGPLSNGGLTIGDQVLAVNGRSFTGDSLKAAIKAANGQGPAVQLLVKAGDVYRTVSLDWHGGLRYPRLEKVGKGQGRSTRCSPRADQIREGLYA